MKINDVLDENLHKWFKEKWVRFGPDGKVKGPCARGSSKEGKPKCLPRAKANALGKKGRASAAARKRREDPNPNRSGKAINVRTKKKKANEAYSDRFKNRPSILDQIRGKKLTDLVKGQTVEYWLKWLMKYGSDESKQYAQSELNKINEGDVVTLPIVHVQKAAELFKGNRMMPPITDEFSMDLLTRQIIRFLLKNPTLVDHIPANDLPKFAHDVAVYIVRKNKLPVREAASNLPKSKEHYLSRAEAYQKLADQIYQYMNRDEKSVDKESYNRYLTVYVNFMHFVSFFKQLAGVEKYDQSLIDYMIQQVPSLRSEVMQVHEAANAAQQAAIAISMKKAGKKPKNEAEDAGNMVGVANIPKALKHHGWELVPSNNFDIQKYHKPGVGLAILDRRLPGFCRFRLTNKHGGYGVMTYGWQEAVKYLEKHDPITEASVSDAEKALLAAKQIVKSYTYGEINDIVEQLLRLASKYNISVNDFIEAKHALSLNKRTQREVLELFLKPFAVAASKTLEATSPISDGGDSRGAQLGVGRSSTTLEDYTGIESGDMGSMGAERTPEENPYGGLRSRKFRGAISENPNESPVGYQEGGWREYSPKVSGLNEMDSFDNYTPYTAVPAGLDEVTTHTGEYYTLIVNGNRIVTDNNKERLEKLAKEYLSDHPEAKAEVRSNKSVSEAISIEKPTYVLKVNGKKVSKSENRKEVDDLLDFVKQNHPNAKTTITKEILKQINPKLNYVIYVDGKPVVKAQKYKDLKDYLKFLRMHHPDSLTDIRREMTNESDNIRDVNETSSTGAGGGSAGIGGGGGVGIPSTYEEEYGQFKRKGARKTMSLTF